MIDIFEKGRKKRGGRSRGGYFKFGRFLKIIFCRFKKTKQFFKDNKKPEIKLISFTDFIFVRARFSENNK